MAEKTVEIIGGKLTRFPYTLERGEMIAMLEGGGYLDQMTREQIDRIPLAFKPTME